MPVIETSGPIGCKGHDVPLPEPWVHRPPHVVCEAHRPPLVIDAMLAAQRRIAFKVLSYLGGTVMDFLHRTTDVFGSLPNIIVDPRNRSLPHPVGPKDPGAEPLGVLHQEMQCRPLDGNARSLKPDTQLRENVVNEALIARVVCQPVPNVAVIMRDERIDFWWRVHIALLSSDLDRRYRICRVAARRRQRSPP